MEREMEPKAHDADLTSAPLTAENLAEAEGAALDALVAQLEGVTGLVEKDGRMCHVREWDPEGCAWRDNMQEWVMWVDYAPSQRWDHGGPIIERARVQIGFTGDGRGWQAAVNPDASADWCIPWHDGSTPLIAAMRAFVASKR
jgi:hypothetical protein